MSDAREDFGLTSNDDISSLNSTNTSATAAAAAYSKQVPNEIEVLAPNSNLPETSTSVNEGAEGAREAPNQVQNRDEPDAEAGVIPDVPGTTGVPGVPVVPGTDIPDVQDAKNVFELEEEDKINFAVAEEASNNADIIGSSSNDDNSVASTEDSGVESAAANGVPEGNSENVEDIPGVPDITGAPGVQGVPGVPEHPESGEEASKEAPNEVPVDDEVPREVPHEVTLEVRNDEVTEVTHKDPNEVTDNAAVSELSAPITYEARTSSAHVILATPPRPAVRRSVSPHRRESSQVSQMSQVSQVSQVSQERTDDLSGSLADVGSKEEDLVVLRPKKRSTPSPRPVPKPR